MVLYQGTNVDGMAAVPDWKTLDGPQIFLKGQIEWLGSTCNVAYFENLGTEDAIVKILVARTAAPEIGG